MYVLKKFLPLMVGVALTACGGGGSGAPAAPAPGPGPLPIDPPTPSTPLGRAGVYDVNFGPFTGIYTFLDDGEFYGLHFIREDLLGHPRGILPATNSTTELSNISWANFVDDAARVGVQESAAVFGRTFDSRLSITIRSASMGPLSGSATQQKPYAEGLTRTLYNDPIALTALAGGYQGYARTVGIQKPREQVDTMAIDAAGAVTASVGDCTLNGRLVQYKATGIYRLDAAMNGANCKFSPVLKGIVTPIAVRTGVPTLAIQVNSADRPETLVMIMTKN